MTIHTLTFKDGSTTDVEAPDDASVDQLVELANSQKYTSGAKRREERAAERNVELEALRAQRMSMRDRDDGNALGRGISRGIDVTQQNLGSAVEGIGSLLGLEGLEQYGADVALSNEAELQKAERNATRLSDVEGVGTGLSYVGELAGESSPAMAQSLAGGAAGAAIGAGFGGVGAIPGSVIGAAIGAGLAAFPLFFGSNRERQKEAIDRGIRTEISEGAAALTAIPQAALDSILTVLGARFFVGSGAEVAGGLLTRARKGATAGAIVEVPTEIGQAVLERAQAGLPIADAEAMREYGEAGIAAGILGGGIGGVAGAVKSPADTKAEPEAEPTQLEMDLQGGIGAAPRPGLRTNFEGEQGEMFADEVDLGQTPQREGGAPKPDSRQAKIDFDPEPDGEPDLVDRMQQKLLTGPDDLGLRNEADAGVPTTRGQRTARTSEGLASLLKTKKETKALLEQANAELQNDGMITPETFKALRDRPIKEVSEATEGTRYEPILSILGQAPLASAPDVPQDNRGLTETQRDLTPPREVQDKQRFANVIASQKRDSVAPDARRSARAESIVAEEQAAQDRARERQGIAALGVSIGGGLTPEGQRTNVVDLIPSNQEAFEQPDLFALQQEQEKRLVEPTQDPVDREALEPKKTDTPEITARKAAARKAVGELEKPVGMFEPLDTRAVNPETDLIDRIARDKAQETNANVRKATERARQEQEVTDVDTELGLREMQAKVIEPKRRTADRDRPEQLSFFQDSNFKGRNRRKPRKEQPDVEPVDTAAGGDSDAGAGPEREGRRGAKTSAGADGTKPSDGEGVGRAGRRTSKSGDGAGEGDGTLKKVLPTFPERDTVRKYGKDLTPRGPAGSSKVGARKPKLRQTNTRKELLARYKGTADNTANMVPDDVLTDVDDQAVLNLLDEGATTRDKLGVAAVRYLSKYPRPEEGLYTAIHDVIAQTPGFQRTKDMSAEQIELFRQTGKIPAARTMYWAMNNLSLKTQKWMAETKNDILAKLRADSGLDYTKPPTESKADVDRRTTKAATTVEIIQAEARKDNDLVKAFEKVSISPDVFKFLQGSIDTYRPRRDLGKTAFESYLASVKNTFNPETNEIYTDEEWRALTVFGKGGKSKKAKAAAEKADSWLLQQYADFEMLAEMDLALREDAVVNTSMPLHPVAVKAIQQGDLAGALNALGVSSANPLVQRLATKLAKNVITAERLAEIKAATKNSKVKGVVYHGSPKTDIVEFKSSDYTQGLYFSPNRGLSQDYVGRRKSDGTAGDGRVYEVMLDIRNPLVIKGTDKQSLLDRIDVALGRKTEKEVRRAQRDKRTASMILSKERIAELKRQGYDGIMNEDAMEYVAFDASQVYNMVNDPANSTKLVVKENLKSDDGVPVAGYFDPKTNTITLNKTSGINAHTLLHEMVHAAVSANLANKSHPLTKKLNKIFEGLQKQDTASGEYGLTNLDEFVSEAMSNPDFQTQLQTTTVNGRNALQQAIRAIANYVRTLLGRPTVPETSTFDAVDNLVQDLISPTNARRNASKLYMMTSTVEGSKKFINGLAAKTIEADNAYINAAHDALVVIPKKARQVFLKFQPVNVLGKLAKSRIEDAPELNTIVNAMSNALREADDKLRPLVDDIRQMTKSKSPKMLQDVATLSYLLPNSSYFRIDPRIADFKKAYSVKKDAAKRLDPADAKEIHEALRKEFLSMDKSVQDMYRTIINMFESRLTDAKAAVDEVIAASIPDEQGRASATKKLAEMLEAERGVISPFVPLGRDGNYRLEYNTIDPVSRLPDYYTEYFDSVAERGRAKKNLAEYNAKLLASGKLSPAQTAIINNSELIEGVRGANYNFDQAPKNSFVYNLLEQLIAAGVPQETYNGVIELVLDSMPERSFMQSFRKRGDVRGFQGDITPTGMAQQKFDLLGTVQGKGRDYNRQIIQMTYGSKIQKWKIKVNAKVKGKQIDDITADYKKTLFDIANFAQSPNVSRWSQNLTSFGYAWTMGANLSSAATAVFDVPTSVLPRLGGKYGDKKTAYALGRATRLLKNSPKEKYIDSYSSKVDKDGKALLEKRKINGGFAGFSVVNYDFDAIRKMTNDALAKLGMTKAQQKDVLDLEVLAKVGSEGGQFSQSLNQEHMDVTRGKDRLEVMNAVTSFLFHHSERYSREVTMIMTYQLELDRLRKNPKKNEQNLADSEKQRRAAREAVNETETSLGSTASAGRPVIAQSGVGNVFMLFKRFAISKYAMMAEMTHDAFKNVKTKEEKQDRAIARGQLGRFMVSSGAFAGVAGMPLMGAIGQLYDIYRDDDEDNFDAVLDKSLGETLSRGLVNAALGADMASRIEMNSLLYRPPFINKDQSELWTMAEQLGGPAVGIYLSMERGWDLIMNQGEFVRGTEAIMPAAIRNVMKGTRYATEGALTRRGNVISDDFGIPQIIMQFAGAAPDALAQQYRRNRNNRDKDDYLKTTRVNLLRRANIAAAENDYAGYREALKKIREYNRNLPAAARARKVIMPDSIERSRKAFDKRTAGMIGGIEYSPYMVSSNNEYDKGLFGF